MDSEFSPLTGGGRGSSSKLSLYCWWFLNIALVVFVFLAFVLSAATLAKEHVISNEINTSYSTIGSGPGVVQDYKVAASHTIEKGAIVSFTDNVNEIAKGLGPQWGTPAQVLGSTTTARFADFESLTDSQAIYAYVPSGSPNIIRVQLVSTPATSNVGLTGNAYWTTVDPVVYFKMKPLSNYVFAILFLTWHNETESIVTFISTGKASTDYSTVTLDTPQVVPGIGPNWTISRDLLVLRDESADGSALVAAVWGDEGTSCNKKWYTLNVNNPALKLDAITPTDNFDIQCSFPLESHYLVGGFFVVTNSHLIAIAQATFGASPTISPLAQVELGILYESVSITPLGNGGTIVISGQQREGVEGPVLMTQVIDWATKKPYLTVHKPTALLPSAQFDVTRHHVRSCYVGATNYHPTGVLLFTYVDADTGMASLVRGKLNKLNEWSWVLSSPRVFVSTMPYVARGREEDAFGPLLLCTSELAYLAYQAQPSVINSFFWHGGYRLAGIAQSAGNAGQSVKIVRVGTSTAGSSAGYPLLTGFSYYANNSGDFHPTISTNELFTGNGWPLRLGTALSETDLLLDIEVIDRINNAY